ncbi:MAG: hypothetical protein Kow00121_30640 [Elainellaceae cyanobacterium]
MRIELIHPHSYDFEDLRYELGRENGEVCPRTLYYWLSSIGIERNAMGFYEEEDLEILKLWITLKPELRTIRRFKAFLRQHRRRRSDATQ